MLEKPGKRFRSVKGLDAGLEVKSERLVTRTQDAGRRTQGKAKARHDRHQRKMESGPSFKFSTKL